jgi:hypothetical protein
MTKIMNMPDDGATADRSLQRDLQQILEGGLDTPAARAVVQGAGRAEDPNVATELKRIAETTALDRNLRLTFDALCSLQRLGDFKGYFLANTAAHKTKKWLAYYSLLLLGRDPGDEQAAALLDRIGTETSDNHIAGALAEAAYVRGLAEEYGKLATAEAKAAFLLKSSGGDWSPYPAEHSGESMHPSVEWAHRELATLSKDSPEAAARALARLDLSADYPDERLRRSYQDHLKSFLSAEAREAFEKL